MRPIVLAPDSFKESLSARDVCRAMERGIRSVWPNADIVHKPMADGGEGTIEALHFSAHASIVPVSVCDALGRKRQASFAWIAHSHTAVIESAQANGIEHIHSSERDIWHSTSFGVGELIAAACDYGAESIIVCLGGSASNDGGIGIASALGAIISDENGPFVPQGPIDIQRIRSIDLSPLQRRLGSITCIAATDVTNPLVGDQGATRVFSPQKGATVHDVEQLETSLSYLADIVTKNETSVDLRNKPGAGAAGGSGWACMQFLHASVKSGALLIADLIGVEKKIACASFVFTGEGKIDSQTAHGKVIAGIGSLAQAHNIPVIAFGGSVEIAPDALADQGIGAILPIIKGPCTLEYALSKADLYIEHAIASACRLITLAAQQ